MRLSGWHHDKYYIGLSDLVFIRELDSGTHGVLHEVVVKNTIRLAVKINNGAISLPFLTSEIKMVEKIDHVNVIKFIDYFIDTNRIYIIMEYGDADLFHRLQTCKSHRFQEAEAKVIFRQIVQGVQACHACNIVHGDIKPENIVFFDGVPKLVDFGHAFIGQSEIQRGTLDYLAPEIIIGRKFGAGVDIWALGVLLYEMLVGEPTFEDELNYVTRINIKYVNYRMPKHLSPHAKDLIASILVYDHINRPTTAEILNHPWLLD